LTLPERGDFTPPRRFKNIPPNEAIDLRAPGLLERLRDDLPMPSLLNAPHW
jgi:hypothetical protein